MRYDQNDRESSNVEDRRGQGPGGFPFPRGGMQIPIGGRGGFSLTSLLIIGAVMLLFGINPLEVLLGPNSQISMPDMPHSERPSRGPSDIPGLPGSRQSQSPGSDDEAIFVKRVLADTEDVWNSVFKSFGRAYRDPPLVLYSGITRTACGAGQAAMGPFYCPLDQKVYIDLVFYDQLKRKFNVSGDFAQAYVIAHEVGHHVQKQLGILDKVQALKERSYDEATANQIQVRAELQADCLAGVWANLNDQMKNRLQPGDVEEALNAATQIGDDMIQRRMTGRVIPDAFTHGTAAQRVRWFKTGLESGRMEVCDTFNTASP
ncbi:KPN_02809 family neutral zinc metallopeptidase [Hyphomicrobium sp.]|uniref:KPN_02809 family neutral zinc metallopeptidase n=1 Tax=Hyphomicrobium sp. TaxID=82 RepID=UPI002D77772D|nr:neutral zinc metallopeptidase [Hyphomicrobium sp.]HET6388034.1 neutral zinc metallopeptidase [Hyphomicrobium sp.]